MIFNGRNSSKLFPIYLFNRKHLVKCQKFRESISRTVVLEFYWVPPSIVIRNVYETPLSGLSPHVVWENFLRCLVVLRYTVQKNENRIDNSCYDGCPVKTVSRY